MSFINVCTVVRVHYRTEFGDFISIRGSDHGLSWDEGTEANWQLSGNGEDVWELAIVGHSIGEIHFKPLINDEVWAKGADYVVMAGDVVDIYPFFFAKRGTVFKTSFHSHVLDNLRKLAIYLPPSYHENTFKRYPVMLFQDGHNLFDTQESFCSDTWQLGETMDDLCCHGAIQEYIVVGVYPVQREWEYLPKKNRGVGGGADVYLDMLEHELRPRIDAHLRTTNSYAIAGSSYGGLISLYGWVTRPHFFSICGGFSPSVKYEGYFAEMFKRNLKARPADHKLYVDCGSVKDDSGAVIEMARDLARHPAVDNGRFLFVLGQGHSHCERDWALRAPGALMYMFADPQRVQTGQVVLQDSEGSDSEEGIN